MSIVADTASGKVGLVLLLADQLVADRLLATLPTISALTITMEGNANGAPHGDAAAFAKGFADRYAHRMITDGMGHNLPQEAPQAFAQAVIDVDPGGGSAALAARAREDNEYNTLSVGSESPDRFR